MSDDGEQQFDDAQDFGEEQQHHHEQGEEHHEHEHAEATEEQAQAAEHEFVEEEQAAQTEEVAEEGQVEQQEEQAPAVEEAGEQEQTYAEQEAQTEEAVAQEEAPAEQEAAVQEEAAAQEEAPAEQEAQAEEAFAHEEAAAAVEQTEEAPAATEAVEEAVEESTSAAETAAVEAEAASSAPAAAEKPAGAMSMADRIAMFSGGAKPATPTNKRQFAEDTGSSVRAKTSAPVTAPSSAPAASSGPSTPKATSVAALAKNDTVHAVAGATGKHSYSDEETVAFSEHINKTLAGDEHLADRLPLNAAAGDLFGALRDGILVCKLINKAVPDTVDERALNLPKGKDLSVYQINENQNVAINAAKAIGCKVVNVHNQDLIEGTPHICLGLIWQIVRIQLLGQINLKEHPELVRLLEEGEELSDLLKLPADQILLRWINYHLKNANHPRRVANFGKDLQDSECYTILLDQIGKCGKNGLQISDLAERAGLVITNAKGLGVESFIVPENIVTGNQKLNLAFCAQIFNTCPGLTVTEDELQDMAGLLDDDVGDSREERVFRMWINSLGIEDLYINNLYEDLKDGVVLLQVMDKVEPGIVAWKQVNRPPANKFKKVENANYSVTLGKQMNFSLVGIGGVDIVNGNKKLILSIVWQLMRSHSLKMLSELGGESGKSATDQDILAWANERVQKSGKESSMSSFKDASLANSAFFFDLCSALAPGIVNPEIVTPGETPEDRQSNAKYVISVARKLGATVFLTWEDIVEVKPKMLMTFTASLMLWDATNRKAN